MSNPCGLRLNGDTYIPLAPYWWVACSTILFWLFNMLASGLTKKFKNICCKKTTGDDYEAMAAGDSENRAVENEKPQNDKSSDDADGDLTIPSPSFVFVQYVIAIAHFVYLLLNLPEGSGWFRYQWLYVHFMNSSFPMLLWVADLNYGISFSLIWAPVLTHCIPGAIVFLLCILMVSVVVAGVGCGILLIYAIVHCFFGCLGINTSTYVEKWKLKTLGKKLYLSFLIMLLFQLLFDWMVLVYEEGIEWQDLVGYGVQKEEYRARTTACYFGSMENGVFSGFSKVITWL